MENCVDRKRSNHIFMNWDLAIAVFLPGISIFYAFYLFYQKKYRRGAISLLASLIVILIFIICFHFIPFTSQG
jgi:uncharacterized membrane protein YoaK (UPF0700 family)